jgi:hypothetical protein
MMPQLATWLPEKVYAEGPIAPIESGASNTQSDDDLVPDYEGNNPTGIDAPSQDNGIDEDSLIPPSDQ